jgi:RNA12 protein
VAIRDLGLYAESRLYKWLRRITVDRLTIKRLDAADVDADAAWQERHDAQVALHSYLHDIPSKCLVYFILPNPRLLQRTSRFSMDPREVASQKCCPVYSRTESGTYHCYISLAYSALVTLVRTSPVLIIDCAELLRANSDTRLIEALSRQTGYWPVFTFLNSMNNLIDLASVGLIGQKGMLSEK